MSLFIRSYFLCQQCFDSMNPHPDITFRQTSDSGLSLIHIYPSLYEGLKEMTAGRVNITYAKGSNLIGLSLIHIYANNGASTVLW